MADLFPTGSTEQVRNALDLRLTTSNLPDAIINQVIFKDEALEQLLAADPNALTYTDPSTAFSRAHRAMVYLVAALIAPVLPNLTRLELGDSVFAWEKWDGLARAAQLRALAQAAIALNTEADGLVPAMRQFETARGYRGR